MSSSVKVTNGSGSENPSNKTLSKNYTSPKTLIFRRSISIWVRHPKRVIKSTTPIPMIRTRPIRNHKRIVQGIRRTLVLAIITSVHRDATRVAEVGSTTCFCVVIRVEILDSVPLKYQYMIKMSSLRTYASLICAPVIPRLYALLSPHRQMTVQP